MKDIQSALHKILWYIYVTMMIVILANVLLFQHIEYTYKKEYAISLIVFLVLGAGGIIGSYVLLVKLFDGLKQKLPWLGKTRNQSIIMLFVTMGVMLLLAILSYHYFFVSGWDVLCVQSGARALAYNHGQIDHFYFSSCPNNLMLMCIYAKICKIGSLFGIDYVNLCCVLFQCVIFALTGFFVFQAGRMMFGARKGLFAWMLYMVFIGMSPWVVVPYSDGTGLVFPVLILYLYLCVRRNKRPMICLFLITCVSYVAYNIKPQLLVIGIAIAILAVIEICTKIYQGATIKKYIKNCFCIVAGLVVGWLIVSSATYIKGFELNKEGNIGMLHYLKMGLNEETGGTYSIEDAEMSNSYLTRKERNSANIQEIRNRIQNMGLIGLGKLGQKKLLTIYSDGTFGWWVEGGFFEGGIESGNPELREYLCSVYYPEGENYSLFCSWVQTIWIGILFLCFWGAFFKEHKKEMLVLMLSIIGITLFELLFEARARYLFTYGPIYVLMAISGIEVVCKKWMKCIHKH